MRCRRLSILLLTLTTTACQGYSLHELRRITPQGTPFQSVLALKYLEFASAEEKEYDWWDSMYFADKGLMAAYGKDVAPEDLATRDIAEDKRPDLEAARSALIAQLTAENLEKKPQVAGEAQFYFDCWVEQQEEAWQVEDIDYCRDNFEERLAILQQPPEPEPVAEAPPEAAPQTAPEQPEVPIVSSYLVYFGWSRVVLDTKAIATINDVVEELNTMEPPYTVTINGHTDTSGGTAYNLTLSKTRAENVRRALIARGIDSRAISVYGFGETDPAVPTPDNVQEPANRRVEIFLDD